MKHILYSLRFLLRGKSNNLIKIISLTLGLVIALLLFSKVSYEISYDTSYPDVNQLYRLERSVSLKGESAYDGPVIPGAIPGGIKAEIPGIEMSVLTLAFVDDNLFFHEETLYKEKTIVADTAFFDMFGIQLIEGNKELLGLSNNVFLSHSLAKRIFRDQSAVGQTIIMGKDAQVTVAGVFTDMPENSHLYTDVVLSIETAFKEWGNRKDWVMNDSYFGYLKLEKGVSAQTIEAQVADVVNRHSQESEAAAIGIEAVYTLLPVKEIHSGDPTVKKMLVILSLLAISLLVVAAMNYVLISISSLVKRAKAIGVHKCNGASSKDVFMQFIYETAILILISLLLSGILALIFREPIQTLLQLPITAIFSVQNIYVVVLVVAAIMLAAGIIPGWIFSSIPVTQVFRTYTATNRNWKNILLFVQFGGIAFIVSLLWIIVNQYDMMIHKDMGYTVENIVYTENTENATGEQLKLLKQEIERMPQVISASIASNLPIERMNGFPVMDEARENMLFSARSMSADRDYLNTLGIETKLGATFPDNMDRWHLIVNEAFVEAMGWTDSPVGKTYNFGDLEAVVSGVVKNYHLMTLHAQQAAIFQGFPPMMIYPYDGHRSEHKLIVRLHQSDGWVLAEMNNKLREILQNNNISFVDYQTRINTSYKEARLFRDSILVAAIIMVLIALLGLIGYVEDELNRRSKEIGIRKINGATVKDVLITVSRDVLYISIPSVIVGIIISYIIGGQWLQQFAEKIPLSVFLFLTSGSFVLAVIILCVIQRSWKVANENPVNSIKTE